MNNPYKSAELAELKELHNNLKSLEHVSQNIASVESSIKDLSGKSYNGPQGYQLTTNHYQKEFNAYVSKNQTKKAAILGSVLVVAVVILVIMGICWLCMSGIFAKDTYLHTPEIIKEYAGTYYTVSGHQLNSKLTITSCNEKGAFDGTFEFSGQDQYTDKTVSGKYSVTGKITTKSREGYVNATLKFKEWIDRPSGYNPLNDMQIKIYDDYQAIRCFGYNMCMYASDRIQPTAVADLDTQEIIGTYSGDFTPNTGDKGTASIIIDSCDASGQVTGIFEYFFTGNIKNGTGKWTLTGQITEKYSDGTVVLTLNPNEQVSNNYMFYYPSAMTAEIYNNYRSLDSSEGIHCFYEDEGFKEDPDPVQTPTQQMVNKVAPVAFPVYIVVALVVLAILASKKTDVFTEEQQRKLDELLKKDNENQKTNEAANKQRALQQKQRDQETLENSRAMLRSFRAQQQELQQKINECSLLGSGDKSALTVESLIYRMESGRADSVKEALLQLDESNRRFYEEQMRTEMERQERDRRIRAEADARWNQAMHNMAVEREQRRQSDELERIRKALED